MKSFYHVDATSVAEAVSYLDKYGAKAKVMAGGTDLLHQMKGFIRADLPDYIINIKTIPGLDKITEDSAGLHIGPLVPLSSIAVDPTVVSKYGALAQAARAVASPQIRNIGTIGGNLCQEVWCWYYRWEHNQFNCIRKGGATCFASAGDNTFHSIFGGPKGCYAVVPSDTAMALLALGASVKTSQRTLALDSFFLDTAPGNVLKANEIITEIVVPPPPSDAKQVFLKYGRRKSFDFAIASVGLLAAPKSGTVTTASIWLGGVAPMPVRATGAENALKGNTISETVANNAAAAAVANATPMTKNSYKTSIVKALVKRAILA